MLTAAEIELRRVGVRAWRDLPATCGGEHRAAGVYRHPAAGARGPPRCAPLQLAPDRLAMWLRDLRAALQSAGQWDALAQDEAGQAVLEVLRLHEGAEAEFEASPVMRLQRLHPVGQPGVGRRQVFAAASAGRTGRDIAASATAGPAHARRGVARLR
jgi:hypothetical protein